MTTNLSVPSLVGWVGLVVSPMALYFGYLRYRTKAGIRIYGGYGTTSSVSCHQTYVSSVILENQKDRAATIFAIYLRVGHNYYIEVENFEDAPLILKAFETYKKNYEPIDFYSVGWQRRIEMDELMRDSKISKKLVLSTSQGKYKVPKPYQHWSPVTDFFKNYTIGIVRSVRSTYKGHAYGANVAYLVEITFGKDGEQAIPIHARDHEVRRFKNFRLTAEALESKQNLETFLKQQQEEGNLIANTIEVHDLKEWRAKTWDEEFQMIKATHISRFQFSVMGRLYTWLDRRRMRQQNKLNARLRKKAKSEATKKEAPSILDQ